MLAGNYVEFNKAIHQDGKTDTGEKVTVGIYSCEIEVGDDTKTRNIVILKSFCMQQIQILIEQKNG